MVAVFVAVMLHVTVLPLSEPVFSSDHSASLVSETRVDEPTSEIDAVPDKRLACVPGSSDPPIAHAEAASDSRGSKRVTRGLIAREVSLERARSAPAML